MNGRALRRRRIRDFTWAALAALLPATECLAESATSSGIVGPERGLVAKAAALFRGGQSVASPGRPRFSAPPNLIAGLVRAQSPTSETPAGSFNAVVGELPPLPPEPSLPVAPQPAPAPAVAPEAAAVPAVAPEAAAAPAAAPEAAAAPAVASERVADGDVTTAACATCGGFHRSLDGPVFHGAAGCAGGSCIPGRKPCNVPADECNTMLGQFCTNLFQCLCCPDPCYQPQWVPAANASFFADYARPRTVTRIRYDNLNDMKVPDRNQYWLKSLPINTKNPFVVNGARYRANPSANMQQLYLYQEAAGEKGSFFVEIPYRQINPLFSPTQAGFGDINFGLKSLLFDCELLQVSFQFRTYTPSGNAMNALGTGHFSLEPSILTSLKLTPTTYFQAQFGNWIPLGGTSPIAGGIFFWYLSLNQVLFNVMPDSPVIATLEMDGWSFEDGGYTRPIVTPGVSSVRTSGGGVSYFNLGPGLRWSICNKVDIGGALTFPTTGLHWAEPWFRFEVRFLF